MMKFFSKAMPAIVGLGIPVGLCLAGAALPIAYDLKQSIGRIDANLTNIEKFTQREFDELGKKIDAAHKDIQGLAVRMKDSETDPAMLMARAGVGVETDVTLVSIAGTILAFPKDKLAEARLLRTGYIKHEVTPVIYGYTPAGTTLILPAPRRP